MWKILKEMGIPHHLICLLRNLCVGQEATVRIGHGTMDWFKTGKEYDKAVYCHPAYFTSMQSTSCEMLGWVNHKLESRLPGEISTTSEIQMLLLLLSHFSRVRLCATPEMAAYQALLSLGFSRQEHWSGLPFPSPMHESEK